MYLAARPAVDIARYQGDGTITQLKHPINPGFQVDFESFSLESAHSATYRLEGLPKPRHHSHYRIGLAVELTKDELSNRWPHVPGWLTTGALGTLLLEVKNANGGTIATCQGDVSNLYWDWLTGEVPLGEIRSTVSQLCDTSRVSSELHKEEMLAELRVSYVPGADAAHRQARIRIAAGGFD
jgi:hypothetical protein